MKIGYLRVSTDDQNTARQTDGLKTICDELHIEKVSAVGKKRPVFDAILDKLKAGDMLVVWDLDRAFRSTIDAILTADMLRERGVNFQICELRVDTSEPAGELVYTIMAAFAQFERRNLSRRTKQGMAAAKRRGKHVGRRRLIADADLADSVRLIEDESKTAGEIAELLDVKVDTLRKAMKRYNAEKQQI